MAGKIRIYEVPESGLHSPVYYPTQLPDILTVCLMSHRFCAELNRATRPRRKTCCLLYDELRLLAAQKLSREPAGQTLQATALVHEVYLRWPVESGRTGAIASSSWRRPRKPCAGF